ncbi:PREDICTED: twinkle homolog protein, chloroplastic/mitochondrial isoform X2 [Ipomoea nil]|uniref:twinkle homolog protein, chloroplastic/mitochondrial isoform X2 n=1 Tax=Ipomoea nil TaxID=35883 RepID=UPI0009009F8F|nr:PREDICTED: twinkle homolog protein, chloroplastic/mitochondrial isoform X2 [Ipomoea nil]
MLHLQPRGGLFSYSFSSCSCKLNNLLVIMASSKHLVHTSLKSSFIVALKPVLNSITPSAPSRLIHTHGHALIFSAFASKPVSPARQASRLSYRAHRVPPPVSLEDGPEAKSSRLNLLNQKLKEAGIDSVSCAPGQYSGLHCPMCKGGDNNVRSLSLYIDHKGDTALWTCFRGKCGWRGSAQALGDTKLTKEDMKKSLKSIKKYRQLDEQSLRLEPLSSEALGDTKSTNGDMKKSLKSNKKYRQLDEQSLRLEPLSSEALGDTKSTNGDMKKSLKSNKKYRQLDEHSLRLEPLSSELLTYFSQRMISGETLRRNGVMQHKAYNQIVIAFPYRRNGEIVSCKYRDINKKFWQESDTERILYGLDDITGASDIIIVEGEMDKLAMEEAGFRNCVSVPDGAPASVSEKELPPEDQDTKYQFLWNCKEFFEKASRIILATDGDSPGQALAEELARRLGRERCWRVKWPKKINGHCKDANEVLMYLGPDELREVIENAELYPIKGLFNFRDYFDEIDSYYHQTVAFDLGVSTGWRGLNELYNVVPGELTVVTGVPNSGKSEWIDALLCNLNRSVGWKFILCSMENKVREHARKLLEKHIRKPFFNVRYGNDAERMSVEEFERGKEWLSDTFSLIRCENDSLPNIDWVLKLAKAAVLRHGVNGLVIDPYNELDHQRSPSQTETEYVSQMLTKIKRFAQHHSCHVWFVAHPRQLHHWVGGPPNLYDISGSAHFINKCDNGIVIHRNRDPEAGPLDLVQVCVRKVRNKVIGTVGDAFLSYSRLTGEFVDIDESPKQQKKS